MKQHAFEYVRVRRREINVNDCHRADFGTRIYAVDRRAKALLGLEAVGYDESFPRYHISSRDF